MSTNFVEFAESVLAEATTLEADFSQQAQRLATRYNVVLTPPTSPQISGEPLFRGDQFTPFTAAGGSVSGGVPQALSRRSTAFAGLDSTDYAGAVLKGKNFFQRWFGTPNADTLLNDALDTLENGTVTGLMEDYIRLNQQEANEIRMRAMLDYNREEDTLLLSGAKLAAPRMPGSVFHQVAVLKERTHEKIRDELRKLGGEGLQREFSLVMGLIEERLKLNHEAKRAMARWVSGVDDPLYASKGQHDDAVLSAAAGVQEQLQTIARQLADLDRRGIGLSETVLATKRAITLAPTDARLDRSEVELQAMAADLQALGAHLAGAYNRLRASFGAQWATNISKTINREDV